MQYTYLNLVPLFSAGQDKALQLILAILYSSGDATWKQNPEARDLVLNKLSANLKADKVMLHA